MMLEGNGGFCRSIMRSCGPVPMLMVLFLFLACTTTSRTLWAKEKKDKQNVKNVIIMVPDGCSQSIQTLARWYKGAPLNLDGMSTGAVRTHMANSVITGSAAAATAFASGYKTTARFIGT